MEGLNGYILLYRKLIKWGWYKDSVVKDLFLHLLLTASYVDFDYMGERYPAGTLITDSQKLADDLGFSRQQIRTALKKLESTKEISVKSTNKFSAVKVHKWGDYQVSKVVEQPTDNQQITNNQPTDNQPPYKENNKTIKEELLSLSNSARAREGKQVYGRYENVYLSTVEFAEILHVCGAVGAMDYIDRLSCYLKNGGKEKPNHSVVILDWYKRDERKECKYGKN